MIWLALWLVLQVGIVVGYFLRAWGTRVPPKLYLTRHEYEYDQKMFVTELERRVDLERAA